MKTSAVFGTAHLYAIVADDEVPRLLDAAWDAGFRSYDTAPSYGFGDSEPALGRLLARHGTDDVEITTKVGIASSARSGRATRAAKALARRLPATARERLRGDRPPGGGAFGVAEVRASLERSLRALPHIDRLLLHEVAADDITDELLALLHGVVERGDVGRLGVATTGEATAAALGRAPDLLRTANVSIDPMTRSAVPAGVEIFGHGPLGAGAGVLRAVTARRRSDPAWADGWDDAVAGARWTSPADVLLARAAGLPDLAGVIVASSRPDRLAHLVDVIADPGPTPAQLDDRLAELTLE